MRRFACVLAAAFALFAPTARAGRDVTTPLDSLLESAPTPTALRAALAAHAEAVSASQVDIAAFAWRCVGESHMRSGHPDSARAAFARACDAQPGAACWAGQAEALAARGRDGVPAALRFAAGLPERAGGEDGLAGEQLRLWVALARAGGQGLAAQRTTIAPALRALRRTSPPLDLRLSWLRRYGRTLVALDASGSWPLLRPAVLRTRGRDSTLRVLATAAGHVYLGEPFGEWLASELASADRSMDSTLRALGARRLAVRAADGFPLRAWFAPARTPHAPLVTLLVADPTTADSLVEQLRRDGCGVALLEVRGSGGSVAQGCACAEDWPGHDDALALAVARDLVAATRAALLAGGGDATRLAVGAAGSYAQAAALAARQDARLRAVVLAAPELPPVARGPFVATLAASGAPVFVQTGAGDPEGNAVVDRLVARLPARQPRVAEVPGTADGWALFRAGADAGARLTNWLKDAWSRPRATPPPPRR